MPSTKPRCLLVSDFNLENLAAILSNSKDLWDDPRIEIIPEIASFGQVTQVLLDESYWTSKPEYGLVWTRPEAILPAYNNLVQTGVLNADKLFEEVDEFCVNLEKSAERVKALFIPTWVKPNYQRGNSLREMKSGAGVAHTLMKINLNLVEKLQSVPNIFVLDTNRWLSTTGQRAFNPKLWYMGKIAFSNNLFKEAAFDLLSSISALSGGSRKLLIVDLDDTLWGGIVGDAGWENLRLGGHDPVGEAFVAFQQELKKLTFRGVILGIVSKNEESIALEAIDKHPEMVLVQKDFAGWKINWEDKAQNIIDLVDELNLGLQSVVFIDDNPAERARVRDALTEVLVPELPKDPMLYASILQNLACFDSPLISAEDEQRTEMYKTERKRTELKADSGNLEEWLEKLEIKVVIEPLNPSNLQRTTQLLNKTNQMNLSTRRKTEEELKNWESGEGRHLWTFRVSDKFGDSGLTGIASVDANDQNLQIIDFILSCRVFGRNVEQVMLNTIIEYARQEGFDYVHATYLSTPKNKPCLRFFEESGMEQDGNNFKWTVSQTFSIPHFIEVSNDN
ncbi:MAG: HAD-IIIC family phosphatase [Candidatus Electryonea clarkiae]|nr:HAD-IIIC family phosphatase [Candidatus Electryonea clarkiae]MDP8288218.1 HAD-IIIC family phosphatase [Candidatus Electryonea clarkiae]